MEQLRQLHFYRHLYYHLNREDMFWEVWKIKSVKFPSSVLVPFVFLLIMGVSWKVGIGCIDLLASNLNVFSVRCKESSLDLFLLVIISSSSNVKMRSFVKLVNNHLYYLLAKVHRMSTKRSKKFFFFTTQWKLKNCYCVILPQ